MTPTEQQIYQVRGVVRWYLTTHYGTPDEPGVPAMFCDPSRVGAFAVSREALARGDGRALFKLLIATTMFQRRQDVQIARILRGISRRDAHELTSSHRLLRLADQCPCPHARSTEALHRSCDLAKDPASGVGTCDANPDVDCHLKRHTVLLKRYGHFGKMPTSVAVSLREARASSLSELRAEILRQTPAPLERAVALESALSRAWRVSQKIASMFLSAVTNPDLAPDGAAAWQDGVDWTYYVVVDSNVDLFLSAINYRGGSGYDARRSFIQALARGIDLSSMLPTLRQYNPRLVQQAMYLFMSVANRRALAGDCMSEGPRSCQRCPRTLSAMCPVSSL